MIQHSIFSYGPGRPIYSFRIENEKGEYADILTYGAVIQSLCVRNAAGGLTDIVLGYDTAEQYNNRLTYLGAVIGRVTNRISGASFSLLGTEYSLFDTGGGVSLHGGKVGFNNRYFDLVEEDPAANSITLSLVSCSGDEGYPGTLVLRVKYTLTKTSNLIIEYDANVDSASAFNPTNHSHFNLGGHDSDKNMLDTLLFINSSYVLPLGKDFTPTGEFLNVEGTPFDFRKPKPIGKDILCNDEQFSIAGGYDISYVIDPFAKITVPPSFENISDDKTLTTAAYARSSATGIEMLLQTDQPCVQFYSGNFLFDSICKKNAHYDHRYGFCLETQGYPDAVNKKTMPPVSFFPGESYHSKTIYSFAVTD